MPLRHPTPPHAKQAMPHAHRLFIVTAPAVLLSTNCYSGLQAALSGYVMTGISVQHNLRHAANNINSA